MIVHNYEQITIPQRIELLQTWADGGVSFDNGVLKECERNQEIFEPLVDLLLQRVPDVVLKFTPLGPKQWLTKKKRQFRQDILHVVSVHLIPDLAKEVVSYL